MKVQKRNRITICASFIRPIISGDGDSALAFAKALEEKGAEVSVISLNPYARLPFKSSHGSIKVYRSVYFNNSFIGKVVSRLAFIPIITINAALSDTVLVYGRMLSYKYSLFIAKVFGKKIVFRSTLLGFDDVQTLMQKRGIEGKINKWIFQNIDLYFATTPALSKRWVEAGLPLNKVFQSPQGVNVDIFKPADESKKKLLREQLQLPPNCLIICSIGDLCYRKGYADISKALKGIDHQFVYIVLGAKEPKKGLWGQKANAKEIFEVKKILETNLSGKVNLLGLVQKPEDYLRASDIFLHFSQTEGLSNAMLQAMACGLPIVVRPIEGLAEYVLFDKKNCLFANSSFEIAECIFSLINSSNQRDSIGENAYKFAENSIDVKIVANGFLEKIT